MTLAESSQMAAAARGLARLAGRLDALGYPAAPLESASGLPLLWLDRGAGYRPAAVLSTQIEPAAFDAALEVACKLAAKRPLSLLVHGSKRAAPTQLRLRDQDVALALYEPLDPCALRFQLNRALGPLDAPVREAKRAPTEMEMIVKVGRRTRWVRVYTLSSRGAFLLMDRPPRAGRRVQLVVPVNGQHRPRAQGHVTFVNHAHDPSHPQLPPGAAVRFDRIDAIGACAIDHLVQKWLAGLTV